MRSFTDAERRARLVTRHHLARSADDPLAAAAAVVALHSSDPTTPHLALWARVAGYRDADLDEALETRGLWRLHGIRRTLWVVPADRAGAFAVAAHKVLSTETRRVSGWVEQLSDDPERWLDEARDQVIAAVQASPGVRTRELTQVLPMLAEKVTVGSGKWTQDVIIGSRLLFLMAMELRLFRTPSSSWRDSQYGWAIAPPTDPVPAARAREDLARDYLGRFGPVTTNDLRWWAGWTVTQTRAALAACKAQAVGLDEGEGWILPGDDEPVGEATGVATLLPSLDPTAMGHKDRAFYLGEHQALLFDRNGNVGPTSWIDGRIVGGWAVVDGRVRLRLLEDIGAEATRRMEERAHDLEAWLQGTTVTPRFRTPLEKELST